MENSNDFSCQVIKQIVAAVNFFHKVFDQKVPCESENDFLISEYVFKHSKRPRRFREPVLVQHLLSMLNRLDLEKCSLFYLRNIGIMIVGFFGFFRVNELKNLYVKDVIFCC